jgi:hypothetical protein
MEIKEMSKRIFAFFAVIFLTLHGFAQVPGKMSYQAVIRNSSNGLVMNQSVGMQISILQGSALGTAVYVEIHSLTSNANGLVSMEIGAGTVVSGSFSAINWANGPYFIKTETDPTGGTNYIITGISEILSLPYAMYAETSGSNIPGPQGPQGAAGPMGSVGPAGPQGPQGPQGPTELVSFTHYIGEIFGGGVIFHLWKDSAGTEHGLIVDITDLSNAQVWSNVNNTFIGQAAQSGWQGMNNSMAVAGQAGHNNSASALCLNSTNGGQSDWYLPSNAELSLLWHCRFNVNKSLSSIAGASLLPLLTTYWSSTEYLAYSAYIFYFNQGIATAIDKSSSLKVRAIRAF